MIESDLVPLDELPHEEPESDVLGSGAEHSVSRHASAPVLSLLMETEEKVLNPSSIRKLGRYTASLAP